MSLSISEAMAWGWRGQPGRSENGPRARFRRALLEWVDDVLRCRSVRGVQAVRIGGQPVHHRVPLLRAPAAAARPQAAARRRLRRPLAAAAAMVVSAAL